MLAAKTARTCISMLIEIKNSTINLCVAIKTKIITYSFKAV